MERQQYPNLRDYPGGPPRRPYDVTGWTLPLQMGVEAVALMEPLLGQLRPADLSLGVDSLPTGEWLVAERRFTGSYALVNRFLKTGGMVYSLAQDVPGIPPGSFVLHADSRRRVSLAELSRQLQVPLIPLPPGSARPEKMAAPLKNSRVGLYQPWIARVYDEGWLRLVLDEFHFPYRVLQNDDLRSTSNLSDKLDVLIFTSQNSQTILKGRYKLGYTPPVGEPQVYKEYQGGIETAGVKNLKRFLEKGGTVLFFGEACNFAIEALKLPATNFLKNVKRDDFFIPGSILRMQLDPSSSLCLGMPEETAVYLNNNVALQLKPYPQEIRETGFFDDHHLLLSGWAVGEDKLYNQAALAEIPVGKGKAILYAFRPQHRGQTYGTFKLIFNALYKKSE